MTAQVSSLGILKFTMSPPVHPVGKLNDKLTVLFRKAANKGTLVTRKTTRVMLPLYVTSSQTTDKTDRAALRTLLSGNCKK